MDLTLERRESSRSTCPLCREEVEASERVTCACGVDYHPACRAELAGCVTLGCAAAPAVTAPSAAPRPARRCCRCDRAITNRPITCGTCGERHHRRCGRRECRAAVAERDARAALRRPAQEAPGPAIAARPAPAGAAVDPGHTRAIAPDTPPASRGRGAAWLVIMAVLVLGGAAAGSALGGGGALLGGLLALCCGAILAVLDG